ncbi:ATP-binding cassette domain-containing protein [Photobacterium lutimaris]|uniref:ABC transporter ATP-binding protein n=1 Tax=Photobacterium lutimaris TaxID=388278 RepID=A0A2T3IY36_9GAMM|nr:ATP-binding cassette domain-containing protein [Photobacterium lutimaris]PSU33510.1 ABC transporter ATP-binding protein [Photobacterium lutimaris]TDR74659.1 ATPase subunit of ABC transporter with duplicated ATPase domains [Photobacterium lutimaris]
MPASITPVLLTQKLSFQLDSGEWLFEDINFSLNHRLIGLVGRNGVGKSVFFSLLLGKLVPTRGNVTRQGKIAYYAQLPSELLGAELSIAQYLGVSEKIAALKLIESGRYEPELFEVIAEDWDVETRTKQLLTSLRIVPDLEAYCHTLSGGQMALLQLHQLFNSEADILLLDEPSNHLDAEGRQWLIERMKQFEGQVLLISHDRALLRHVEGIYQLTSLGLRFFKGNYDAFFEQSTTQSDALDKQLSSLKSEQKRLERQAQANKEKAQQREAHGNRLRKSGSQPKILLDAMKDKAGQSRSAAVTNQQNLMDRNQAQLNILTKQKETLKPQAMYLQQSTQTKKNTLLSVEDCRLDFGSKASISFTLSQTERCYVQGANGCGKSTLLKAIQGEHSNFSGEIKSRVPTVYLDQHFGLLDLDDSMLESLMKHSRGLTESEARILLAGIGFRRDSVYRNVGKLSGGEKMKLSMLLVSHRPHLPLLLLDEPDNHLDIEAKHLLAMALKTYKGAFLLVSHDEDFVAEVGINRCIRLR